MSFFDSLMELLTTNWKTTTVGFVALLAAFLSKYGIELSPDAQATLNNWILGVGLFLLGMFSKDGDNSNSNE